METVVSTTKKLVKTLFIGEDVSYYETLTSIIGESIFWDQNKEFVEKELIVYDVLFIDKKSFYKYHELIKKIKKEKTNFSVFLLNNEIPLTPNEIQNLKKYSVSDSFQLPTQVDQLKKTWDFIHRINTKKIDQKPNLNYYLKPKAPKRIFDVFVSFSGLLLLSPFLLLIICLIKITSKGPLFYASKRVGNGYRIFDFYKFRTMRVDADQMIDQMQKLNQYVVESSKMAKDDTQLTNLCSYCQGKGECQEKLYNDHMVLCERAFVEEQENGQDKAFLKVKNDPRITPIGHFLRKSSIDELPQLFNVLRGDMSLVGNRPLPLYEAENLTTDTDSERFLAPAGLTGLWQVMKRGKGKMSAAERKDLDNQYARNQSFWGDILLLLKTIPALFQKEDV